MGVLHCVPNTRLELKHWHRLILKLKRGRDFNQKEKKLIIIIMTRGREIRQNG